MTNAFTFNDIEYSKNEKGYCYKFNSDKKVRIGKAEYEQAYQDAKAEAEYWAKKDKEEQDAKATEDAFNGVAGDGTPLEQVGKEIAQQAKAKAKKARKSKDIALAVTVTLADDKIADVTLTKKQVAFLKELPKCREWEDITLNNPICCDGIAMDIDWNPMAVGAMVSTLREKGLVVVKKMEDLKGKPKAMMFTVLGIEVYARI